MDKPLFDADDLRKLAAMLGTLKNEHVGWDDCATVMNLVDGLLEVAAEMESSHG